MKWLPLMAIGACLAASCGESGTEDGMCRPTDSGCNFVAGSSGGGGKAAGNGGASGASVAAGGSSTAGVSGVGGTSGAGGTAGVGGATAEAWTVDPAIWTRLPFDWHQNCDVYVADANLVPPIELKWASCGPGCQVADAKQWGFVSSQYAVTVESDHHVVVRLGGYARQKPPLIVQRWTDLDDTPDHPVTSALKLDHGPMQGATLDCSLSYDFSSVDHNSFLGFLPKPPGTRETFMRRGALASEWKFAVPVPPKAGGNVSRAAVKANDLSVFFSGATVNRLRFDTNEWEIIEDAASYLLTGQGNRVAWLRNDDVLMEWTSTSGKRTLVANADPTTIHFALSSTFAVGLGVESVNQIVSKARLWRVQLADGGTPSAIVGDWLPGFPAQPSGLQTWGDYALLLVVAADSTRRYYVVHLPTNKAWQLPKEQPGRRFSAGFFAVSADYVIVGDFALPGTFNLERIFRYRLADLDQFAGPPVSGD